MREFLIILTLSLYIQNVENISNDFSIRHIPSGNSSHIDSISSTYLQILPNVIDTSNWKFDNELNHYFYKDLNFDGGTLTLASPDSTHNQPSLESISLSSGNYSMDWDNFNLSVNNILDDSLFYGYKDEILEADKIQRFYLYDYEEGKSTDFSLSIFLNDSCIIQRILIESN